MTGDLLYQIMALQGIEIYTFYALTGDNERLVFNREKSLKPFIKNYECSPTGNRFLRLEVPEEDWVKGILVALFPYDMDAASENELGVVDGFSYGYDYHVEIKNKMQLILEDFKSLFHYQGDAEICVDNSPYMDREIALYGGLGKYGKNQMLYHPHYGSQFFIGYIAFKEEVQGSIFAAHRIDLSDVQVRACRTCTKCQEACPVNICKGENPDASKCVGMLTQTKRKLSEAEKVAMGKQLYGCSLCQKVCPLNKKKPFPLIKSNSQEKPLTVDIEKLLLMTNRDFKTAYGHMGFSWRSLWVYKRNALINMGNFGGIEALMFLKDKAQFAKDPHLSEDYFWAISKLQKRLK